MDIIGKKVRALRNVNNLKVDGKVGKIVEYKKVEKNELSANIGIEFNNYKNPFKKDGLVWYNENSITIKSEIIILG